jgi:two-component system OmpR family response regulator
MNTFADISGSAARVLIVDDERANRELFKILLTQEGYVLLTAASGEEALAIVADENPDLILLDVMMPGMDGLAVLRKIRDAGHRVPVLMLTARGDEADRVVGLELGADDYIAKPFSPRELLARLRAVMRRAQPDSVSEKLSSAGITVDTGAREAWVDGKPVELTGLEIDLLIALLRRAGRVVPRSALLELAGRGDVSVGERAVDVHISRLRKKLGDDDATRIRTVRGVGYVLARAAEDA